MFHNYKVPCRGHVDSNFALARDGFALRSEIFVVNQPCGGAPSAGGRAMSRAHLSVRIVARLLLLFRSTRGTCSEHVLYTSPSARSPRGRLSGCNGTSCVILI